MGDPIEDLLRNRKNVLRQLDKADAEDRLIDFAQLVWPSLEPGRPFVRGWVIEDMFEHLEAVSRGEIKKLLMNVPPGFMKSLATSVLWPAWEWGPRNRPDLRYLCASYSHDLTIRDNGRTRRVIASDDYQEFWGDRFVIDPNQDAKVKFANDHRGYKIATSCGGLGTGERADRIIVDDPHNVLEAESDAKRNSALQWFTEVMATRVNDIKTAVFIVIMQRVHEADVAGLILEKELGYTHYCVPMWYDPNHPLIEKRRCWSGWRGDRRGVECGGSGLEGQLAFPERYGKEEVDGMVKTMMAWGGSYSVAGQMQQRPEPRGGGMVQEDWFEIVDEGPRTGEGVSCRGWDFASTEGGEGAGSASVKTCETWTGGQSDLWITDCWWARVSPGGLYEHIRMTVKDDGYSVFQSLPQDPGQSGKYQVNDLLEIFAGYDFEFSLESGDKVVRFRPFAAQAETRAKLARKIKIVRASWNAVFIEHICKFPMGRFKDIPDATSRSYGGTVRRSGSGYTIGGSRVIHTSGASDGSRNVRN